MPLAVISSTNVACLSNCPWHGTSEQVHEQQILHIELGVFGEENDLENRNPAAGALSQKRSRRDQSCYSVGPASNAHIHWYFQEAKGTVDTMLDRL